MYGSFPNEIQKPSGVYIGTDAIISFAILCLIGGLLYFSLYMQNPYPLVALTIPLVLYDRAYMYPMFVAIALTQGAYSDASSGVGTGDSSFAESATILAVAPMLAYDLLTQKSKMVPFRFAIIYLLFFIFIYIGLFVYYQHPENYKGLPGGTGKYGPAAHSIMKSIKIIFYLFYLRVLINYPIATNYRAIDVTRRCIPFIIIPLSIYLLTNGRVQNGAGYSGTLQLGDAHHGAFTSQLCAMAIYSFITLFSLKPGINGFTRFFALGCIAMTGVMIMMMGSRNGLLSFIIACGLGVLVNLQRKKLDFQFLVVLLCFLGGVVVIILAWDSPTIQRAVYMTDEAGGGERTYYWTAGVKAVTSSPVFGMGGDESASISAVARLAPPMVADRVMHNTYLEVAVEYGLVAFVLYLALVFFTLKWGWRLYKIALDRGDLLLAAPALSYLIIMIASMFISAIWDTVMWYTMSFVFVLAIQIAYPAYINKRRVNTKLSYEHLMAESRLGRI